MFFLYVIFSPQPSTSRRNFTPPRQRQPITVSSAERVRQFRSRQQSEDQEADRERDAERKRMRRARLSPDTVSSQRLQNTEFRSRLRTERSSDTSATQTRGNSVLQSRLRAQRSPSTIASQTSENTVGRSRLRAGRSPVAVATQRTDNAAEQRRLRTQRQVSVGTHLEALNFTNDFPATLYLGNMDKICQECQALHFSAEKTANDADKFSTCCHKGAVQLPPLRDLPDLISALLTGEL